TSNPVPLTVEVQNEVSIASMSTTVDDYTPSPSNYAYQSETTTLDSSADIDFGVLGDYHGYRMMPGGPLVMLPGQVGEGTTQLTRLMIGGSQVWVFKTPTVRNLVQSIVSNPSLTFPIPGTGSLSPNGDGTYALAVNVPVKQAYSIGGLFHPYGVGATINVTVDPLA